MTDYDDVDARPNAGRYRCPECGAVDGDLDGINCLTCGVGVEALP